ncbi:transglycosylase domain-containing protein [Rhodococcus sp. NPDC058521]|uniref:transglycosylase domain-containing protein n=1 Tax=Rhodococcus sp. NPDC058521 TaxID=3346536 RepID=UPI0036534DCA
MPTGADGPPPAGSNTPKTDHRWRNVRRSILVVAVVLLVVPALVFAIAYVRAEVPKPSDMVTNQVATILAADGTSELAKVIPPEGNRTEVDLTEIPEHVRNAVLSAEDRNFYSNPGFSISGFTRAARDNVLGKDSAGGGSTITQQYVKNVLVGSDRSITRKMRELVISTKMNNEWSKDEILAAYLNTIYFGRGAYGVDSAARAYFDKPIGELSVAEGAVLAAVIQSPSYLDPEANPDKLESRWNYVLDGMVDMGVLDSEERANTEMPVAAPANRPTEANSEPGPNGLIRNQVLRELGEVGISEQTLNTEGLRITTTIDPKAQAAALDGVHSTLEGEDPELRTAVVSVDPKTGGVSAYYGGEDGNGYDYAQAPLQTGSSFKAFGLAAALDQGIPLSARYSSAPLTVADLEIGNVEGESCGVCSIAEATKRSLNTSFYRLMMSMEDGPQAIADAAHAAGIPEQIPGLDGPSLSHEGGPPEGGIVLGQYQARPIDMASAYATFAASGIYRKPHFVQKVVDADGDVLFERRPDPGERRIDEAVADNISQALMPVASYSKGHGLAGGRPSAAKTGTAQLGETGENKDAWMVGYTPSLSTAVWMGTADATAINNSWGGLIYGSGLPSDIWKDTMDGALEDTDWEDFPWPDSIGGQAGVPSGGGGDSSSYDSGGTTTGNSGGNTESGQQQQPPPPAEEPAAPPPVEVPPVEIPTPAEPPQQVEILPGVVIPLPG